MSDTRTILGISMVPQKNRRILVAVTYTIFVACTVALLVMPSWIHELGPVARHFLIPLVGGLLALFPIWFSYLAKLPLPLSRGTPVEMTRLGLTPRPRDPYDPDERQVVIRNAAHYQAFRVVIIYSFVLFFTSMFLHDLNDSTARRWMMALLLLLLFMVLSLPQAIILWTEPDAPEEDRAYNLK